RRRGPRQTARPTTRSRRRWRWRWASGVAALLLVTVLGVDVGRPLLLPLLADHASGTGEVRRVTLPDGSEVELDSRSAIDVLYSDGERRVRLLAGEACFSVAPMGGDERRPFVVESAGGTTRALGTRFLVGERGHGAWVGVLEHSVAVNLEGVPGERVLSEGQSARYDRTQGIQPLLGLDLQRASSWRRGVLVFDRVPLAEVAEQLNRYRTRRLVITDARLARREVSGVFRLDILDEALDTLTHELHAQRLDVPGATFLY
ncbi:FecR family protein, partial [Metapseudomonas otitidis]|uniref:FecR family protein n=1 Tax=Metapseudomonas otitidis TaxID=319939 RepID=UPI001F0F9F2D